MKISEISKQLSRVGLQQRDSQLDMIQSIYDALEKKQIICIEAPTGTGKTISYCIAATQARNKHKIIISTSTIALQEQLINQDLPLLNKILGTEIKYGLAKGRRRYVCLNRLFNNSWQQDFINDDTDYISKLQLAFQKNQWNGDRDELPITLENSQWQDISTDRTGCSGKACEYYEECVFYKTRKKNHLADILVVNHSLLLSDLELGAGTILPEPEKSIYIIDECHHLPDKALNHFSKSDRIMASVDWINQLTRSINKAQQHDYIDEQTQTLLKDTAHDLVQALKDMRTILDLNKNQFDDGIWRLTEIPDDMLNISKTISGLCAKIVGHCELIYMDLDKRLQEKLISTDDKPEAEKVFATLGFVNSKANNLYETWNLFGHQRKEKEAPTAKWFEQYDDGYICHAAPINVSNQLKQLFWDKAENGAVLCSATISALGKFDDFCRKVGLKNHEAMMEKTIQPHFNYEQSVLYIPNMQFEPSGRNSQAHLDETIKIIPELILPKTGTLVLFTSRRAMEAAASAMPNELFADILMQSQFNKSKLIDKHKKRIRSGKRSIIFGLASFGEGLDLPADFCQHVIIHKLPFAVPTTPIELTRNEWLQKNQLNAFMLSSLPEASIRLKQYTGRLLRQETDIGIVTILDKRLYSKQYGAKLLANLPQFTRLVNSSIEQLKQNEAIAHLYEQ